MFKKQLYLLMIGVLLTTGSSAATISWATYFGSLNREYITAVAIDKKGNIYAVGSTESSTGIATGGSFQSTYGGDGGGNSSNFPGDAFIAKYNSAGLLQWVTYYGGADDEGATGVGCDSNGRVYVSGWTRSVNGIATAGSHQTVHGGGEDAFLVCFDSTGRRQWGTYFGGTGNENSLLSGSMHVDSGGNCYLTGKTSSPNNITTLRSHQPNYSGGSSDAYIAKFSKDGQRIWGTYYGTSTTSSNSSEGTGMFIHGSALYIVGATNNPTGFSTVNAFQTAYAGGTNDGFLAKFDTSGILEWSTYYGGSLTDKASAVTANDNFVYITGTTNSTSGISNVSSHQEIFGGNQDIFLAQFSVTGHRNWATYYGGTSLDASGRAMALDILGNVYFTGNAASQTNISSTGPIQSISGGGQDAIIAKFSPLGTRIWGTYFGGTGADYGYGIVSNGNGLLHIVGRTVSATRIATAGAQQTLIAGDNDGFVLSINDCDLIAKPDDITGDTLICASHLRTYKINTVNGAMSYTWILPSGWIGQSNTDSITTIPDSTSGSIKVVANGICSSSDTQTLYIRVSPQAQVIPASPKTCMGDSVLLHTNITTGSFQWMYNNLPITGATTPYLRAAASGTYTLITNNNVCVDTSAPVNLIVFPFVNVPGINKTGQILSLPVGFSTYQWNFNGVPITGATGATYTYAIDGDYSVNVTDSNGCRGTSPILNTRNSAANSPSVPVIQIFPNPIVNGQLNIHLPSYGTARISSPEGRSIGSWKLKSGANTIDISMLPKGVYLVSVADHSGTVLQYTKITNK